MNVAKKAVSESLTAQITAVSSLKGKVEKSILKAADIINGCNGNIILIGVGKSGYIGMKIAATLTSLGHRAFFLHPVEAFHGDLGSLQKGDVAIVISNSGKGEEIVKISKYLKSVLDIRIVCITGNANSPLGIIADCVIAYDINSEGCPIGQAPMASTTTSLVIGDLIASALTSKSSFAKEDFARFHPGGSLGLSLKKAREVMITRPSLPYVDSDKSFDEVIDIINKYSLGTTAVVDKDFALTGSITDGDIRRAVRLHEKVKHLKAKDFMHSSPKSVHLETSLLDILSLMELNKITSVFVLNDENSLEGIVHMHNIIEGHII